MTIETGRCGDGLTWTFDPDEARLTIAGEGPMWDYARYWEDGGTAPPWRGRALELAFEGNITSIGRAAFEGCYIETLEIPGSVKAIGMAAFDECGICELTLHEGLEFIGEIAFFGNRFRDLTLPSTLEVLGDRAFGGPEGFLEYITMPTGIAAFGHPNDWTEGGAYIFGEGFQGPRRIDLYGPPPEDWLHWWPVFAFLEGEIYYPAEWRGRERTFSDLPDPRYFAHYPDEDIRNADEDEYIAQAWIPRVEPDSI